MGNEVQARELVDALLGERDDIGKLPLPAAAKAYARRKGLKSMMRQPDDFTRVNAMLLNPGKPNRWKNYDATGKVKHSIKDGVEEAAEFLDEAPPPHGRARAQQFNRRQMAKTSAPKPGTGWNRPPRQGIAQRPQPKVAKGPTKPATGPAKAQPKPKAPVPTVPPKWTFRDVEEPKAAEPTPRPPTPAASAPPPTSPGPSRKPGEVIPFKPSERPPTPIGKDRQGHDGAVIFLDQLHEPGLFVGSSDFLPDFFGHLNDVSGSKLDPDSKNFDYLVRRYGAKAAVKVGNEIRIISKEFPKFTPEQRETLVKYLGSQAVSPVGMVGRWSKSMDHEGVAIDLDKVVKDVDLLRSLKPRR